MNGIVDIIDIKTQNMKAILNALRFSEPLVQKDIAEITGLSVATVSNLCNELKEEGIILETKVAEKRVGRSPNVLSLNHSKFCILALDLQLENTLGLSILNLKNDILVKEYYDISKCKTAEEIVHFAKEMFDKVIIENDLCDVRFIGVGAAVPAVFDTNSNTLTLSAVDLFEHVALKKMLDETFCMTPYVDNIANIRAISMHTCSPDVKNIVCMDISQGVGVGAICHGNLVRGKNGYATEVAHVPIGDPTLVCPTCGGHGCVELELSIDGLVRYYPELSTYSSPILRWKEFVKLVRKDSEKNRLIANKIGDLTGKLASILINMFDPEIFYVTGYFSDIFDIFSTRFFEQINQRCKMAVLQGLQVQVIHEDEGRSLFTGLSDTVYNLWKAI